MARRISDIPLRVKLVAAVSALVAIALLVIGAASAVTLRTYLLDRIDGQLRDTAGSIDLDTIGRDSVEFVLPSEYIAAISKYGVMGPFHASPSAPPLPRIPTQREITEHNGIPYTAPATRGHGRWRLLIRTLGNGQVLIVGENLADMDDVIDRLVAAELIIGLGVLAVLASLGVGMVQASLRPLVEIEHTAEAIAAGDLTRRVPTSGPGTEVGRLASALNTMLAQIEGAFAARAASEERMRQFVADASHELRTPLTTIRGFAELYRQGAVGTREETEALLKRIEDEAARMGLLVEDLLLLARLDQERPLIMAPVELRVLAGDAVDAARVVAPGRRIMLDIPAAPVTVLGDEPRLRQIIGNLVTNGLTHTPDGTPMAVRVRAEAPSAVIEVTDGGPGLTPEQAKRVFERFYRVDKARTRKAAGAGPASAGAAAPQDGPAPRGAAPSVTPHSGTGLGLAIVAALVAAHNGTVTVDSTPGEGATFRVRLPLAPQDVQSGQPPSGAAEPAPNGA